MSDDELDTYIAAAKGLLALRIEPAWYSAIHMNLAATIKFAEFVMQFPLPDDAEPAPTYRA